MEDMTIKAIGGWLKDADAGMDRRRRRLTDLETSAMNPDHIAYFEDYRSRYFNDRLVPGQGVEEILATLMEHGGTPDLWIDLGACVTTLFWSIGVRNPGRVVACDLVPEALSVLSSFKEGKEVPPCYSQAMELVGLSQAEFNITRCRPWDYHLFDCHAPWSLPEYADRFDLITAIGCFGLARDPAHYASAFGAAAANLRPGGRFIGADWVRSAAFIEREGHDNSYISTALTERCGVAHGLSPLSCTRVTIQGDPWYDAVIAWVFSTQESHPGVCRI